MSALSPGDCPSRPRCPPAASHQENQLSSRPLTTRRTEVVRGLLIPSGEDPIEERTLASLPDYQKAVGGWIEAIDLPDVGITIYVNEEGLLRQLPFNPRATFLWCSGCATPDDARGQRARRRATGPQR
ncbi:DUF3846 domain-containing protein [Microbacterium sp. ARD31]|uniref:DUF3846 domain-containing protein n=1 Tax=Microbacterium sp. ARD31 TaxID=2962576 RepID=UPI0037C9D5C3